MCVKLISPYIQKRLKRVQPPPEHKENQVCSAQRFLHLLWQNKRMLMDLINADAD